MGYRHELIRQSPDVMEITSRRLSNLLGCQPVLLPFVRLRLPRDVFLPLPIFLVYIIRANLAIAEYLDV